MNSFFSVSSAADLASLHEQIERYSTRELIHAISLVVKLDRFIEKICMVFLQNEKILIN